MRPTLLHAAVVLAAAACAGHNAGTGASAQSPEARAAADSACAATLASAAAAGDTAVSSPPVVDAVIVPPVPAPAPMLGVAYVASVLVTTSGRVDPDSTLITPAMDPGYEQHFRDRLRRLHFVTAKLHGCPVARRALLHYRFNPGDR